MSTLIFLWVKQKIKVDWYKVNHHTKHLHTMLKIILTFSRVTFKKLIGLGNGAFLGPTALWVLLGLVFPFLYINSKKHFSNWILIFFTLSLHNKFLILPKLKAFQLKTRYPSIKLQNKDNLYLYS